MAAPLIDLVGTAAALCSTGSFVPQVVKLMRERTAEAVSLRMYLLTVAAFALWSGYGAMLRSAPLVISNGANLVLCSLILALRVLYRSRGKD